MTLELSFYLNVTTLTGGTAAGRRTFYARVTIGRHHFYLQRWDTERCTRPDVITRSRDGVMCWTAGRF